MVGEDSWDGATLRRLNKARSSDSRSQGLPLDLTAGSQTPFACVVSKDR